MNESLILGRQSHAESIGHMTDKSGQIQLQLSRAQEEIRMHDERELLNDSCRKIRAKLAEIQGVCVSVASSVNSVEELWRTPRTTSNWVEKRPVTGSCQSNVCDIRRTVSGGAQQYQHPAGCNTGYASYGCKFSGILIFPEIYGKFPEIFGNISKSLEVITCIIFIQIRWYSWQPC